MVDSRFSYTLAEIDLLRGLVRQRIWDTYGNNAYYQDRDAFGKLVEDRVRTLMFGGVRAEQYTDTSNGGQPVLRYREVPA